MSIVAVASVRSCGVTTFAAGLAMVWPGERQRLLVEADPAGGMLAAAAGLRPEPGLVSLAAAARRHDEPGVAFEHCQALPDGIPALCGPPGPERARSALAMLSGLLGRLGELDADVFVDCGRFEPSASNIDLFERADLGVLAVRPRLADLHALGAFLQGRDDRLSRSALVLVGSGPYPPAEVSDALGLDVAGNLPWDPEAAQALATTSVGARQLTRSPLVRALRTLADDLAGRVGSPTNEESQPSCDAVAANGHGSVLEVGR
jgi:MinD-like ATPase involved in chromosome partitioning or flagellar assembly